ncbi:MAG TPA: efflux RND transporter periplasmic adaptor subunit [Terriglobia bacterium]|nr:efflux RND transporter periplasmic adaptor subunit [Terriglobia bacterium]
MPPEQPLLARGQKIVRTENSSDLAGRLSGRNAALQPAKRRPGWQLFEYRMPALLALGVSMVLAGCGGKQAPESEPLVTVQVVRVERSEIRQQVSTEAVLYPLHRATIVPKISAPVEKFYVERGDRVRAGQLVAMLENSDLAAAVAENKGAYQQAEANYESTSASNLPEQTQKAEAAVTSAKASYKAAQQLYASSKKLYQQGALAGKQLNQAEVGLTQAETQLQTAKQQLEKLHSVGLKAQLKAAQGQLAAAKGRYQNAQAQLAYSEIRSPIDGVVTDRPLYQGEMAASGTPLMTVMNLSQVVARAHFPASEAALLKVGDPAEVSVPGETKAVAGKVTVVSPALDPDSTTVQVWVQAPNPRDQLKPGSTVSVSVIARKAPDALVIPKSALVSDSGQGKFVMVIGPGHKTHQTQVQTGIEQDGKVQITQGLKEGDLIVSEGAYGLPDGTRVKY